MTTMLAQAHELTWGECVLDSQAPPDTPYRFDVLVGTSFGNPPPLIEVVRSYLDDGADMAMRTGWGNREDVPVFVLVSAPDGESLAQGEAALAAEFMADRPNPIIWTPPTIGAWSMGFDVITVAPERDWQDLGGLEWDFHERYNYTRVYKLLFTTRPFTRDLTATVIPALPVPEDPDLPAAFSQINTADSTAGWSGFRNPAATAWSALSLSASGGKVRYSGILNWNQAGPYPRLGQRFNWEPGELVKDPEKPYLYVEYDLESYSKSGGAGIWVSWNLGSFLYQNLVAGPVGRQRLTNGRVRAYFDVPDFDVQNAIFVYQPVRPSKASATWTHWLDIYEMGLVDRMEIDGTNGFQVARTAFVDGTAPTGAAVRLDAGESPLVGSTALIYTGRSPVIPLRSQRVSSAAVEDDETMMSGGRNTLASPMVFRIPVTQFNDATYDLIARLSFTGTAVIDWKARLTAADGSDVPGSDLVIDGSVLLRNGTVDPWRIHTIAAPKLPVIQGTGSAAVVELTLSMVTGGSGVTIDEGWLADHDNGAVTIVNEPTAFQLTAIELRSAQLDAPRPAVIGTWAGHGSQDIGRLARLGSHEFQPGLLHIFTATDLAKYAPCTLEYYRRYFLHPGPSLSAEDFSE